jgi:hypothetical protein
LLSQKAFNIRAYCQEVIDLRARVRRKLSPSSKPPHPCLALRHAVPQAAARVILFRCKFDRVSFQWLPITIKIKPKFFTTGYKTLW